jgi:hypothetical protein
MKKLIIGLFSLLFSSLVYPASIKSDTKLVDKNGNATFSGSYHGQEYEGGVPLSATVHFGDWHLEGKRTALYNENSDVRAAFTFTFQGSSSALKAAFGDTLPITYVLLFKGDPMPIEKNLGTFVLNLSSETTPEPQPQPQPQPKPDSELGPEKEKGEDLPEDPSFYMDGEIKVELDSTPERTNAVPAPPNVTLSREVELYTALELERAEQEAADLAFEEGVAAVLAQPEKYGLNDKTTKLSPFVKGWCFVEGLNWVHISNDLFPFIYSEKLKSWILLEEKENGLVYFIYKTQQWATYVDLINF